MRLPEGFHLVFEDIITCEVLPKNITSTPQYAAVPANTSCLLAFVTVVKQMEKANVKRKTTSTWYCAMRLYRVGSSGCISNRIKTGIRSRMAARKVRVPRRRTSNRLGDTRLM